LREGKDQRCVLGGAKRKPAGRRGRGRGPEGFVQVEAKRRAGFLGKSPREKGVKEKGREVGSKEGGAHGLGRGLGGEHGETAKGGQT